MLAAALAGVARSAGVASSRRPFFFLWGGGKEANKGAEDEQPGSNVSWENQRLLWRELHHKAPRHGGQLCMSGDKSEARGCWS